MTQHQDYQIQHKLSELINIIHSFTSVRRYSNKKLIVDENIAEHSSIVALISLFIYDNMSEDSKKSTDLNKVLAFCTFHDFDEIFSGDMLNPVKYFQEAIVNGVNEYVALCMNKFTESSGISSLQYYTDMSNLTPREYAIIKMADIISVFVKFQLENSLGNKLLNVDYGNIVTVLHGEKVTILTKDNPELAEICDTIVEISNFLRVDKFSFSNILQQSYR